MAGYRDTLNLPKTDFPMKADLVRREPERLRWWSERGLYRKLRDARRGRAVWLLHDGPPYSNAHLHLGTAANKIWKDASVRAASLRGLDSPYVPGWDNHGMPIEMEVGKQLRAEGKEADRLTLRRRCREYATKWVGIQRGEFERLGVWGEWENPYLTMAHGFEAEILESLGALAAKGFIERRLRSIHWCPTDRTALALAEIEYQEDPAHSLIVRFPLRRDPSGALARHAGLEALAWTTTPWTLPANLGLMADPGAEYVVVRAGGQRFLLAAARLAAVAESAGWKEHAVEARMKGAAVIGAVFEGPWGNDSPVVDGTPYVSLADGTGLVHMAPGHGREDFEAGRRAGLAVLCPVDTAGRFTAGAEPFVGRSVLDVDPDIIRWVGERGRVLSASKIVHSYPHCWRCRGPVIFRATDQWFMVIDANGHRGKALAAIENEVRWDPPASQNRIRESVRERPDWCLSRQRSWGVGIPAVYCEACDSALLDAGVIGRAAAVTREHGSDAWFEQPVERFLPDGFRCTKCGKGGPFRKETDILDVWFDSGSTHRAVQVTHSALAASWKRAAAGGHIAYFEGPDQHRGWFNSSLMVGVGITDHAPFTDVLTHGWVLDAQGFAMHKSKGNYVALQDVVDKYGAEILRWWALATDWRSDVRVGDEILQRVADAYRKVRNTFRFLLGNLGDFTPDRALPDEKLTRVDRAFARRLAQRVARMREEYEALQFHRALDVLLDLCTVDLSAVFLDVAKDRLYTLAPDDPARRSAQTVLWEALHDLALAASPALVFTAEEAWQHHPGLLAECESVHLAEWPAARPAGADDEWSFLLGVRDAVNAAIEPLRASRELSTTNEAEVEIVTTEAAVRRLEPYRGELEGLLLVAGAAVRPGLGQGAEPAFEVTVKKTRHAKCERCWPYRPDVATDGADRGLCARCVAVLAARPAGRS